MATPPPATFELDLVDGDRVVGWVSADAVGFRGFADAPEAANSSWVAFRAMQRRWARRDGTRPVPIDLERVTLADDDAIHAGGRPIATLIRPTDNRADGTFGFEISFPQQLDEVSARGKAHLMYRTLRRAGTRWSMWLPQPTRSHARPSAATLVTPPMASGTVWWSPMMIAVVCVSILLVAIAVLGPETLATTLAAAGLVGLMGVRLLVLFRGFQPRRATNQRLEEPSW